MKAKGRITAVLGVENKPQPITDGTTQDIKPIADGGEPFAQEQRDGPSQAERAEPPTKRRRVGKVQEK